MMIPSKIVEKWKYFLILLIGIVTTLIFAWYYQFFPFKKNPYLSIPVEFTQTNIPYSTVEIQGRKYTLLIDLGAVGELWLCKDLLGNISKKFVRSVRTINLRGDIYDSTEYLIPKIQIQTSWIKNHHLIREEVYISPSNSMWGFSERCFKKDGTSIDGRIGWGFLTSFYPVFDFGNSIVYFTKGQKTFPELEKKGYRFKDLHHALFEINFIGCVLTVDTNLGRKKFLLDTGCTRSLIKASLIDPKNVQTITDEKKITMLNNVSIGDYFIGDMEFLLLDFHEKFEEIDGVLGIDFFTKNIVYLDFKERQALIGASQTLNPKEYIKRPI